MYRYIILIGLLIVGGLPVISGQAECVTTPNVVSTDPQNPFNPNCDDPLFLNSFDWRLRDYPHGPDGALTIESPFSNDQAGALNYLWNVGSFPLSAQDYQPEDGWELIRFSPSDNTYLVLYNKYTAVMRILFLISDTGPDYDRINAKLSFTGSSDNITGLLHPTTGQSQPMDQPSVSLTQSYVPYANDNGIFMHADIPVEYDPCTCLENTSTMQIDFTLINDMEIDLYGRTSELVQNLASIENGIGGYDENFLTQANLLDLDEAQETAGAHLFNQWGDLVDHYDDLKDQRASLEKKYKFYKIFGEAAGLIKAAPLFSKFKLLTVPLKAIGEDTTIKSGDLLNFVAGGVKLLGAPLKKKIDGINGKISQLGTTTFSHGEIVMQGRMTDEIPLGRSINFYLPGSALANECENYEEGDTDFDPELYPKYNEVLGRFALLKTPELEYEKHSDIYVEYEEDPYGDQYVEFEITGVSNRFKLDASTIEYVFNPALNLAPESEIWASLQFTIGAPLCGSADEYFPDFPQNLTTIEEGDGIAVRSTPLMPLGALNEYIASLVTCESTPILGANLTIAIDYVYDELNSEGEQNRAFQFYYFPLEIPSPTVVSGNAHSPDFMATPNYPDVQTLGTTNFTENTTIFAWNSITIEGELTAAPGVQVEIIAPNIEVVDGGWVDPAIDLYNNFVPFDFESIDPVSMQYVENFCQDRDRYKAGGSTPGVRSEDAPPAKSATATPPPPSGLVATLSPNPVGEAGTTLQINNAEATEVSAAVYDLNGRQLFTLFTSRALSRGAHQFSVPTADLAPGTYLLHLEFTDDTQVIRFVK